MVEDEPSGTAPSEDESDTEDAERTSVLEVFGLKLEVSNPRLADLLTMDAGLALTTDVRELSINGGGTTDRAEVIEAIPDALVAPPSPKSEEDVRARQAFRARAEECAAGMGFAARPDGVWTSPSGAAIVARMVERGVSLAAATHFVDEVAARRAGMGGIDATVLFVVDSQPTADGFKVPIRQRKLHDVMRTVCIDDLDYVAGLCESGTLEHGHALALLSPPAAVDVGEAVSAIRAAQGERGV